MRVFRPIHDRRGRNVDRELEEADGEPSRQNLRGNSNFPIRFCS
jgi:hypothetical protein